MLFRSGIIAINGTYYIQAHHFTWLSLVASVPTALLVMNIITINNLRDIDTDKAVNKNTLAVRIGDRNSRIEYTVSTVLAFLIPLVLALAIGYWLLVLPILAAPLGYKLVSDMWKTPRSPALNPILGRTAQFNLWFAILFSLGLLIKF